MGIRRLFNRFKGKRSPRLEVPPAPKPSELHELANDLPRQLRREHKLLVRRAYRSRLGIVDSRTRQILSEATAPRQLALIEADEKRQAEEDMAYGIAQ